MPEGSADPRQECSVSTPCSTSCLQQIPLAVQYSEWLPLLLSHSFSLVYATDNSFAAVYSDLLPTSFLSFIFTFPTPKLVFMWQSTVSFQVIPNLVSWCHFPGQTLQDFSLRLKPRLGSSASHSPLALVISGHASLLTVFSLGIAITLYWAVLQVQHSMTLTQIPSISVQVQP